MEKLAVLRETFHVAELNEFDEIEEINVFKAGNIVGVLKKVGQNEFGQDLYVVYSPDVEEATVICEVFLNFI